MLEKNLIGYIAEIVHLLEEQKESLIKVFFVWKFFFQNIKYLLHGCISITKIPNNGTNFIQIGCKIFFLSKKTAD